MPVLTVLYGPPTDGEAFSRHYEEVHVPLAKALPGAIDLHYTLAVDNVTGDIPVFAAFHASFTTREALDAALASPEGQTAQADVPNFATGGVTILIGGRPTARSANLTSPAHCECQSDLSPLCPRSAV
ncbi:EthD family reductase [Arthrobacter sp. UYCo732]|uniref:EthD family reductase n=1 Tax=Arthrobacter sp. UYCo732 TaxID=3156336 RepID=UPI0033985108